LNAGDSEDECGIGTREHLFSILNVLTVIVTVILDNFFGRQFNSLNDVSINPRNGEIYFTDPTYGYTQDFRPPPALPKQVWRFDEATGVVRVAADGFQMPNGMHFDLWLTDRLIFPNCSSHCPGITFSPNGKHVYITDTGIAQIDLDFSLPSTM